MGISDIITGYLQAAIDEADGVIELQRCELAEMFGCVPSQINYVIATRFSPEHGYIVESRRGGGGYIRISRVQMDKCSLIMHTVNCIGQEIDLASALIVINNLLHAGAITEHTAVAAAAAIGDKALISVAAANKPALRADILKYILVNVL